MGKDRGRSDHSQSKYDGREGTRRGRRLEEGTAGVRCKISTLTEASWTCAEQAQVMFRV